MQVYQEVLEHQEVRRNPSELRGLCREQKELLKEHLQVVTPPSSEVCAGTSRPMPGTCERRNPSELRGLCRPAGSTTEPGELS